MRASPDPPIVGFSRALYSNWLLHVPLQLLVDAGEGLQVALGPRLYVPTHLAITHGHADHLLGLPGFVAARRFSKGSREKPLSILHPAGTPEIEVVRDVIARLWRGVDFPVTWTPLQPGDRVDLDRNRYVEAFRSNHGNGGPTLGYLVAERRRRLRAEWAGLPQAEIERRARAGHRADMTEEFSHVLFAHTGDAMPVAPAGIAGADLLVHDATFLDADDRKWDIHATTEEALEVARDAGVGCLVLHHLSIRYERGDVIPRLRRQVESVGFEAACWWLDDGECRRVSGGATVTP